MKESMNCNAKGVKRNVAFTMAEILLSLTIIGVVAAITLPSLTGNINERTWTTQRKALYARMSQAVALMPTMNNYGSTVNDRAETFITSGLSKVLKINNICGKDNLADCGFPDQIVVSDGSKKNRPTKISELNSGIPTAYGSAPAIANTYAAALETANGESILVFYNPSCVAQNVQFAATSGDGTTGTPGISAKQHVCANFIFDLNGKKGPNTIGKDIGTMSVLYSSDSTVVMPMYPKKATSTTKTLADSSTACRELDEGQYRLPNVEEAIAMYYNRLIYGDNIWASGEYIWTSTMVDSSKAYYVGYNHGIKYPGAVGGRHTVVCVER